MDKIDEWCAAEKKRREQTKPKKMTSLAWKLGVERARKAKQLKEREMFKQIREEVAEIREERGAASQADRWAREDVQEALRAIKAEELRRLNEGKTRYKNTDIEVKTQQMLTVLNIQFQTDVRLLPGRFNGVDVYIPSRKLVIECDGEYWHANPRTIETDLRKTEMLKDAGYNVLRLWGTEIHKMTPEDLWTRLEEITFSKNT